MHHGTTLTIFEQSTTQTLSYHTYDHVHRYVLLNERMNKLEKMITANIVNPNAKKGSFGAFVDSITTR